MDKSCEAKRRKSSREIKYILHILIVSYFLSSCAIHKKFPFICFKSGCIKVQWGFYEMKAWKKNMDGKANARKKRANGKSNQKKRSNKSSLSNSNNDPNDTLSYFIGDVGKCNSIRMIINSFSDEHSHISSKIDTLIVSYNKTESEVNESGIVQIDNYFRKTSLVNITYIIIEDCDPNSKKNEISHSLLLQRAAKLKDLLIEKGIPKKKVKIN